jgi:hypothetical protein
VIFRASREEDLVLKGEMDYLASNSDGSMRIHYLVGSRKNHPMDAKSLKALVPQIADILNNNIIIVRKDEKRYSEFFIEGVSPSRYVIVDDLICSGNTLKHIIGSIHDDTPRAKCIGAYFYLGEECAFNTSNSKLFEKQFGTVLLNPYGVST